MLLSFLVCEMRELEWCNLLWSEITSANSVAENDWGPATINITQVGNFTKAPYRYRLTPLKQVKKVVKAGAGLGKI